MRPHAVHAVIAVKSLDRAKSRLADYVPLPQRGRLVLAMLADTVCAAASVPMVDSVSVVTPDSAVAAQARALGAAVHPEPDNEQRTSNPDGLNWALTATATTLRRQHGPVDVLALQADLPALHCDELEQMLVIAPSNSRTLVVDHAGTGTAALLAPAGHALQPKFGTDSARRHIDGGAIDLDGDWPGLRLDVDTAADVDRAIELGIGKHTRDLLFDIDWPNTVHRPVPHVC